MAFQHYYCGDALVPVEVDLSGAVMLLSSDGEVGEFWAPVRALLPITPESLDVALADCEPAESVAI